MEAFWPPFFISYSDLLLNNQLSSLRKSSTFNLNHIDSRVKTASIYVCCLVQFYFLTKHFSTVHIKNSNLSFLNIKTRVNVYLSIRWVRVNNKLIVDVILTSNT